MPQIMQINIFIARPSEALQITSLFKFKENLKMLLHREARPTNKLFLEIIHPSASNTSL